MGIVMKNFVCPISRIVTMSVAFMYLKEVYDIGFDGYFLVGLVGLVWAVTTAIEKE